MSASDKDKRRYKRYRQKSEFHLILGKNSFQGTTTDYSLKGFGFSLDSAPPLNAGTNVRFKIKELNLEDEGKIIWTQTFDAYVKGGIEKKSIAGLLEHFPLADILIDLQRSEKNGILQIRNDSIVKNIYIKNGDMVFASSNRKEDRFIEMLLRAGKITNNQYHQVISTSKEKGKSHGTVLVELGYLKPDDLLRAVRDQVEEIILSLFLWQDGNFVFIEGSSLSDKVIKLKFSAANLVYRGIKRIQDSIYIKKALPPVNTVLCYSTDPMDLFQDINLDKTDKDILFLVDGKRTINEIISLSPADKFQTLKTLYSLMSARIIDRKVEGTSADITHEDILKEAEGKLDTEFLERVAYYFKRLNSINYYDFLGIERWAAPDKIKKAYYQAAKDFHPDKHLNIPSSTLKNKLNTIFSHLTVIYKTLTNPEMRVQYDRSLSVRPAEMQAQETPAKKDKGQLARIKFREGEEAYRKGSYAEAKKLIEQAIYLDNFAPSYYFYLGLIHEKEKNFHEAGRFFNQALKLDPGNTDYLAELGHMYLEFGFRLRARSTFEKIIKSNPFHKRAAEGLKRVTGQRK